MNYLEIINLIFGIIFGIVGLLMIHFIVFFFVGIFAKKKYPKTEVRNKFGLIIPARNEEKVVGYLIDSIKQTDYPQDKLTIFVIAHNCTDKTAEVARAHGAVVYEYNNPNECTMGYAFRYLFTQIEKDFKTSSFDGFFLFNADNVVAKDYFTRMNEAFEFYHKEHIITSFRNSKNFGDNTISGMYGVYFALGCFSESRGRTVTGCSTRVQGTGYVIPAKVVENGWKYVTLTEDWEFSADQVIGQSKINYCDDAIFYDEQPTKFKIMWRQRLRWSRGHLLVCVTRFKDFIKSLFSKNNKHKMSTYDIFINCMPFCLVMTGLFLLQLIMTFLSPLFGISLRDAFLATSYDSAIMNIIHPTGYLWNLARTCIMGYIGTLISAIIVFILGRKRIKNVSFIKKVWYTLIWPFFLLIQFPIDIQALFSKNLGWKPIPHDSAKAIQEVEVK